VVDCQILQYFYIKNILYKPTEYAVFNVILSSVYFKENVHFHDTGMCNYQKGVLL
jgi:hypothetical protein